MSLPKYGEYKSSEVEWLQEVPAHWAVKRLIHVASCNDEVLAESTAPDYEIEYVEISGVESGQGIIETALLRFGDAPSRARRIVRDGDILISTVRTYLRAIAQVTNPAKNMIASTGFAVIRPRYVESRYLGYACQTEGFVNDVIARSTGVSYPAINASELVRLHIPLPLLEEQTAIATFLDRETAKIDALIADQEKLIALLAEKRQATISHAVTKGLNPNAPMKDSGVAWLGEVPKNWEITQFKRLCDRITDGAHISPETEGGVFSFVSTKDLDGDSINFEGCLLTSSSNFEYLVRTGCRPALGDVLFSKDGTIGRTAVVQDEHEFVVASSLIIITPDKKILDSSFLNYLCKSSVVSSQVESFVKGAGLPRLSIKNLLKVVGVFPELKEQREISAYLKAETQKAVVLQSEAERAIALLKERRSALITAAVTGQIDVRNLTQEIPA